MTGLDKIILQINSDTQKICEDIKNNSNQRCKDILNSATAEAELIAKKGEADAKFMSADVISRAHSAASLEKRSIMLRAKQQIIKDSLDKCQSYLCSLPNDEYFDLIIKMISKYSEEEKGEICFSLKDLSRIPDNFENTINAVSKGELKISSEPVDIDGGFLLKYGGIEINCAFSAIFSSQSELFSDEVSAILFA